MGVELVLENFINGEFVSSNEYIDSYEPSTGDVWARVPNSTVQDVDDAVQAAKEAFKTWSVRSASERSAILIKVADLIQENLTTLAELESRDQGKPVSLATTMDIPRAAYNMRFFATNILHQNDKSRFLEPHGAVQYTHSHPVGVAGLISPWNLPLYLLTFKIAPALAWGNCVVCKPSEMTSVTAWKLCSILKLAGVPAGVVNMVFGTGAVAGDALVRHPDVRLISFTGSTLTANRIRLACADTCKKLSLELGGKNPGIVFSDADLTECIPTCIKSSFANQGEVCLCTSRIFVQRAIYNEFLQKFVESARKWKVGDPGAGDTRMGALVSREHMAKVTSYVNLAHQGAGRVMCGHGIDNIQLPDKNKQGYFMLPTVITDTPDDGRLMQEEIFGPVTCIVPFDTEEEVVRRANNVEYGLSATLWTQDVNRVHRMSKQLQAGTVWVNCWLLRDLHMPFGGFKSSGVGREGSQDSKDFFTEAQTICIKI